MTNPEPSSDRSPTWQHHDPEARLLVQLLRSSRVSLLFGEAGSDKTSLLKSGLMPLLRRRASDQFAPTVTREFGVVIPFPDRRSRSAARASKRRRELVVYFDDWSGTPLTTLHERIRLAGGIGSVDQAVPPARLAQTLQILCDRLDANFIILLDRFEEYLLAPSDRADFDPFANELVEAIRQPQLPANFLLSLNEEARPRLASLRSRIPSFDDFSLKLAPPQRYEPSAAPVLSPEPPTPPVIQAPPLIEVLTEPVIRSTPTRSETVASAGRPVARPKVKLPPPPKVPVRTEDVYALIESTLARTAAGNPSEPYLPGVSIGPSWVDDNHVPAQQAPAQRLPGGPSLPGDAGDAGDARTRATMLQAIARWVGRLLRHKSRPGQGR